MKKNRMKVTPFFDTHMTYQYDRSSIPVRLSRIKEWDFYQFIKGDLVVQATIGHASIFSSFDSCIYNLKTHEKIRSSHLELLRRNNPIYEANPEKDHELVVKRKDYYLSIKLENGFRRIIHKSKTFDLDLIIENDYKQDKMVILTPFFESDKHFYLNYKENYYTVEGRLKITNSKTNWDGEYNFDGATGLLDCGRGYFPYRHEWYWSSASFNLDDGSKLGWNLGWGFGNLINTENIFFYNSKGYKLNIIESNIENGFIEKNLHLEDDKHIFSVDLIPIHNNISKTKVLWIDNYCDQIFSKATGYVIVDGRKIEFENMTCFLEHATNKW